MTKYLLLLLAASYTSLLTMGQSQAPVPDTATQTAVVVNPNPISEIDIPVRVALKPVYAWANKFVDTLYTSPNYPADWVLDGCETRYQYRFVRGPFAFRATNDALFVTFSGFYGVRGSTRVCTGIGNSPWTPTCSCGFGTEKPRRIDAGFAVRFNLLPTYQLGVTVNQTNPVAVDKCEMCFFGKDVTKTVATQLKTELDASIADMQKQLQTFSLKPYLQTLWDTLQQPYRLPGFGYLHMQPTAIRISQARLRADTLLLSLGLSARPELKDASIANKNPLPALTDFTQRSGFRIFVAQHLPYDSLSMIMNSQIGGKEFTVGKGLIKKTVRIDSIRLIGGGQKMFIKVHVGKGVQGAFYAEAIPVWNPAAQQLTLEQMDFHVESRQWLVRTASWMLDGTITQKLKQYSSFNLADKTRELSTTMLRQMNRTIMPGIISKGYLDKFLVNKLQAAPGGLFIDGSVEGKLWLEIDAAALINRFAQY